MADLSVTASAVVASTGATTSSGTAGATITQGQTLYIDTANSNVLKLFDSDAVAPANVFAGISLNAASSGQPVNYVTQDPSFTPGATLVAGDDVWASDTAGGITKTRAELESGDVIVHLGVALTSTTMYLKPVTGGPQ